MFTPNSGLPFHVHAKFRAYLNFVGLVLSVGRYLFDNAKERDHLTITSTSSILEARSEEKQEALTENPRVTASKARGNDENGILRTIEF
jgi:hypothetical protein